MARLPPTMLLIDHIARFESKLAASRLLCYGSLYFRDFTRLRPLPARFVNFGSALDPDGVNCVRPSFGPLWQGRCASITAEIEALARPCKPSPAHYCSALLCP
jgi:hypothetical protein